MSEIKLSQKQSDAWHYLNDDVTTELLYGGGAGGGKSIVIALNEINGCNRYEGSRGVIGRKNLKDIKDTTLITYYEVCGIVN